MAREIAIKLRGCRIVVASLAVAAITSCGGEPPPAPQVAAARSSLDAASHDGAAAQDPQGFTLAQNKLDRAVQSMSKGHNTDARRLAEEADVDARFAAAKSRAATATATLNQLNGAPPAEP